MNIKKIKRNTFSYDPKEMEIQVPHLASSNAARWHCICLKEATEWRISPPHKIMELISRPEVDD